jgi:hypothetical protein
MKYANYSAEFNPIDSNNINIFIYKLAGTAGCFHLRNKVADPFGMVMDRLHKHFSFTLTTTIPACCKKSSAV